MPKLKQFIVTVSMLPEDKLRELSYSFEAFPKDDPVSSRFPAIPLIKKNLNKSDDYEIIAIMTDDENGFSKINLDYFKDELKKLSDQLGYEIALKDENILTVQPYETQQKHIAFFNSLCKSYKKNAELYVDVTYGTKVSIISQFATLVYAEKNMNCDIAQIIYGLLFGKKDNDSGIIYDIRCLYELNMLIHSCSSIPNMDIEKMLDMFEGE